jgi:Flp pilus assembly protein TadG
MIMLALGVIDFGIYINAGSVVGNAAREGARAASLGASTTNVNTVVTSAISVLPGAGTTMISVTCRKPAGTNCSSYAADAISGGTAIVRVTRVHHWLTPAGFGTTVNIVGSSEMRIE